ncbi:MAG TPA: metallophosphoesterase [Actinomycetes bacterium]|nr:metallophosphoesterase [Actinomycetes bacterium]
MIRVAAVGDVHVGTDSAGRLAPRLAGLADHADVFLLAGDLTHRGRPEEAKVLAEELRGVRVPTIAVLGNHDYHSDEQDGVTEVLEQAGIRVLEGDAVVLEIGGRRVGIAGSKGFGGGFAGASASDFGEPEMKAFVGHTKALAGRLERALGGLRTDRRIVLLHYSPVAETLAGEPREIHAFLGSYLLAEAVDRVGADLVLHGHAHRGSRDGTTPGGVPVRNVAAPVIGRAYEVFRFDAEDASA